MTYTHMGITITLDERSGKFEAVVGGKLEKRDSLAALKKHIEKAALSTFKPFRALHYSNHGVGCYDPDEVDVIGIHEPKRNERDQTTKFRCKLVKKERFRDEFNSINILPLSAKPQIDEIVKWAEETDRIRSKRDEHERMLRKELKPVLVSDHLGGVK